MPMRPLTHRATVARCHAARRAPRRSRGYDQAWLRLRTAHLREHPLCVECERLGHLTVADQVDHIIPFRGLDDPLRLDPANLQSLCASHHTAKTNRQAKGRPRGG
jgi:5-methylcytosine-specific restriction endonuclease McrA